MRSTVAVVAAFLCGVLLCNFLSAANKADKQPASKRADSPSINLLDDENLSRWDCYMQDRKDKTKRDTITKMSDVWSVKDGVLCCKGRPVGYLRTKEKFENFILELQWRWPKGSQPGNSGVLLRAHGEEQVWPRGLEAQLKTENAGDVFTNLGFHVDPIPGRTEDRRTQKIHPCNEKPVGQWNDYRLVMDGDVLTIEVNGLLQNRLTGVEKTPGWILLQSEGRPIEFRKILLTPIK